MTKMIRVGSQLAGEDDFIARLQRSDEASERLLVAQIKTDRATRASDGLVLASKAYRGPVIGLLTKQFAGQLDAATEVWNDTLERIYDRIDTYEPSRSKFKTWVFNQARYAAMDYRRRQAGLPRPVADLGDEIEDASSLHAEPLTDRESRALRSALRRLTPLQRSLVWNRYVRHMTPFEIAREGLSGEIPEDHVKVYVARALTKLRTNYLEELGA